MLAYYAFVVISVCYIKMHFIDPNEEELKSGEANKIEGQTRWLDQCRVFKSSVCTICS